jgi:serine protease Do
MQPTSSNPAAPSGAAGGRRRTIWAAGLLALALGTTALTGLPLTGLPLTGTAQTAPQASSAIILPRQAGPAGFADLAARVAPAVVRVTVTTRVEASPASEAVPPTQRGTPFDQFYRRFEDGRRGQERAPQQAPRSGQGSGFVIDPAGYIVTNNHVVGEAATVTVELPDGRELNARVVGTDVQTDLALLKVDAGAPLPALAWGDSDTLHVGDWVVAMGNPFGLGGTVTAGIVSARGRQIGAGPYDDFIQTDAPINPGNSGGPLFNGNGEVVGINTAIYAPAGGNVGIGFAVPARLARHVIADLQRDGRVARGWLGITMQPIDAELASALLLPDARGVLVAGVEPGGPAATAGLRAGDVVTAIDGKPIAAPRDLALAVAEVVPRASTTLVLLREGRRLEQAVTVGLREAPQREAQATPGVPRPGALGLRLAPRKAAEGGVEVVGVEPGSIAATRGLQPGDVILRAGEREVRVPGDVTAAVAAARSAGRPAIALQVVRDGGRRFVALPLTAAG